MSESVDPNGLIELLAVDVEYLAHVRQTDVVGIPAVFCPDRMKIAIWPAIAPKYRIRVFIELSELVPESPDD